MYGLVNRAVEDLVTHKFGADTWEQVKARAGVDVEVFVAMSPYSDTVTYSLVAAASDLLGMTQPEVLEAFGEYWMQFTARQGYGELLDLMGHDVPSFLEELDEVHERLKLSFPDLVPPSIAVSDVTPASVRVHYRSDRDGLAPFVVGLLRGVGARFGRPVEVTLERGRDAGHDHDEFLVRYLDS